MDPVRKFVYDHTYPDIIHPTFYTDKFMRERSFFEMWERVNAFSNTSHNINYYNDYVSPIDIFALINLSSRIKNVMILHMDVRLFECYPKVISDVSFNHTTNEIQTFETTFSFRY